MTEKNFKIGNFLINEKKRRPFLIAELSGNHNKSLKKCKELIKIAKKNGADAVKIQTYTPDTITINCKKNDFLINQGIWKGNNLYELYSKAFTPIEWHKELFNYAKKLNILLFSTPFDPIFVDYLEQFSPPAYKIASFEINVLDLIKRISETKKPIIMSVGMSNLKEIEKSLNVINKYGSGKCCILYCVSGYPTPIKEFNLNSINYLKEKLNVPIGLSDHTLGNHVACAATAMGVSIIEKHLIKSRKDKGPDSQFSMEPDELLNLRKDTTLIWSSLGKKNLFIKKSEKSNIRYRRSLYFIENIKKGSLINNKNLKCIRPGYGDNPENLKKYLGKRAVKNISLGTRASLRLVK